MQYAREAARGGGFLGSVEMEDHSSVIGQFAGQIEGSLALVHPLHALERSQVIGQRRHLAGVLEEQRQAKLTRCAAERIGNLLQLGWHRHGRNDKPRNIGPVLSLCPMSQTPESLEIVPGVLPSATIAVPGSKSVSNRALVIAAVAE